MAKIKETAQAYRELICRATGLSDLDYENYVFSQAVKYMEINYGQDVLVSELLKTTHFWLWWINHFNHRNAQLVYKHKIKPYSEFLAPERKLILNSFYDAHKAANLFVRPSRVILEQTYAEMIGQVFDNINRNNYDRSNQA